MGSYHKVGTTVSLELTSADPQGALDEMLQMGLSLYSVYRIDELVIGFTIKKSEMQVLRSVIQMRDDSIRVVREKGISNILMRSRRRPVLLLGLALLIFLTVFLPTRILLFRVEGNMALSSSKILEEVHCQGLTFWSKRKDVRSEEIKNILIENIPQIAWVGINTRGCVATVSIRERDAEIVQNYTSPGSIYATRDGIVSSITASKGTALCAPGDAVLEGQLLISGFTDHGDVLFVEAAEGEVYAYTVRDDRAILPVFRSYERPSDVTRHRYSLMIGKKRINFWKGSGIPPTGCDRMYQEYWLKLPGGGVLPVCIIKETIIYHELETHKTSYGVEELSDALEMHVRRQVPGVKILHRDVTFAETEDLLILDAKFGCLEMIGKKRVEQIGDNLWQEQ